MSKYGLIDIKYLDIIKWHEVVIFYKIKSINHKSFYYNV